MATPASIGNPARPPRRAALTASTRPRLASLLGLCVLSMPALVRAAEGGAPASREIDLLSGPLDRVAPWPWKHFSEVASKGLSDVWELREGVLVCRGTPKGYLWLDRDLADFTLRLEWCWPPGKAPGNAGVLFRTTEPHRIWPRSLEAQLNAGQAGDFWGLGGFPLDGPAERKTVVEHPDLGRLTNLKRTETLEKPPGEWNLYEIEAKGATVTLRVNGREVNRATGCDARAGKICLTSEGDEVHFRNVRLIVEEPGGAPPEGGPNRAGGGTRPAQTEDHGKPRPLPSSVSHERLASGEHEYTVRGLYLGPKKGDAPDVVEASKYEIETIPGCTRFVGRDPGLRTRPRSQAGPGRGQEAMTPRDPRRVQRKWRVTDSCSAAPGRSLGFARPGGIIGGAERVQPTGAAARRGDRGGRASSKAGPAGRHSWQGPGRTLSSFLRSRSPGARRPRNQVSGLRNIFTHFLSVLAPSPESWIISGARGQAAAPSLEGQSRV